MSKGLSPKVIEHLKPGDRIKADTGENRGVRFSCGNGGTKNFVYCYRSPIDSKLTQISLGSLPKLSLLQARVALQQRKPLGKKVKCPARETP